MTRASAHRVRVALEARQTLTTRHISTATTQALAARTSALLWLLGVVSCLILLNILYHSSSMSHEQYSLGGVKDGGADP